MSRPDAHDVVVVGGGPAGSVMAWSLARRGVRVAVVERATFPREKVCGDFVEPGGLRILEAMQCRQALDDSTRLPITSTRVFVRSRVAYRGAIPYYQVKHGLPPHGYIVPRHELDTHLLDRARAASATVYEGSAATEIHREGGFVRVGVRILYGGTRSPFFPNSGTEMQLMSRIFSPILLPPARGSQVYTGARALPPLLLGPTTSAVP